MLQVEIQGSDKLDAAIARLKREVPGKVNKALNGIAIEIESESKRSINSHQSVGETYGRHVASAPGSPPNADTGNLANNITVQEIPKGYDVGSRSGAPYGYYLEFGTSKIDPRPWLAPAFKKVASRWEKIIERTIKRGR